MGFFRGDPPTWKTNSNVPAGHAKYDTRRAAIQESEDRRLARVADSHHKARGGLLDHSDEELHHLGYEVRRNFWGQRVAISPRELAQERRHDELVERRREAIRRKELRKAKAKAKAKEVGLKILRGDPKPKRKGFFYWE